MLKLFFLYGIVRPVAIIFIICMIPVVVNKIRDKIDDDKAEKSKVGYSIINDGQLQKAIIQAECVCPVCNTRSGSMTDKGGFEKHQYVYTCRECGTVWQGNIYDNQFNKIK